MRLRPTSLSLRLFLVLAIVLLVAQLFSAFLHFQERGHILYHTAGLSSAERIAGMVRLLDPMTPVERRRAVAALDVPPLRVSLEQPAWPEASTSEFSHAALLKRLLHAHLDKDRQVRVFVRDTSAPLPLQTNLMPMHTHNRFPFNMHREMHQRMMGFGLFLAGGVSVLTQVRLQDRTWLTFDHQVPDEVFAWPWKLLWSLVALLISVIVVTLIAVRWLTRPLDALAHAAAELGRDINRPPLAEKGSSEVQRAARAFNTMQARLGRSFRDRTRMLAAISHDLKTPITRMRLRAEILEDEEVKDKFQYDLDEMETMVQGALDFMRGMDSDEAAQAVDMNALLESLQADAEEAGRQMEIEGNAHSPYVGRPLALKRCLSNLIDNAFKYGSRATVSVEDSPEALRMCVADEGPGIPEAELERVFEPFYRLEDSRSRHTGGTGLGLSIARNIARAHGGELVLQNRAEGGVEAVLSLPR
jgi:signal transduction histidine kinase